MPSYVDTSALVKLIVAEDESVAMRDWWHEQAVTPATSDITRTELLRAVRRIAPDRAVEARALLDATSTLTATTAVFEAAGMLDPTLLRSLDAIHLAAALQLADELDGVVTYDDRMAAAALAHGIPVVTPR